MQKQIINVLGKIPLNTIIMFTQMTSTSDNTNAYPIIADMAWTHDGKHLREKFKLTFLSIEKGTWGINVMKP